MAFSPEPNVLQGVTQNPTIELPKHGGTFWGAAKNLLSKIWSNREDIVRFAAPAIGALLADPTPNLPPFAIKCCYIDRLERLYTASAFLLDTPSFDGQSFRQQIVTELQRVRQVPGSLIYFDKLPPVEKPCLSRVQSQTSQVLQQPQQLTRYI